MAARAAEPRSAAGTEAQRPDIAALTQLLDVITDRTSNSHDAPPLGARGLGSTSRALQLHAQLRGVAVEREGVREHGRARDGSAVVGVEVLGGRAALAVLGVVGRAGPPGLAAEAAEERVEGGGEGAGGLAREQRGRVALGERVRVVARALPRPALARGAVEGPVGVRVAARLGAEDRDPGLLLGGAEREEVPVGAGDAAAVLQLFASEHLIRSIL